MRAELSILLVAFGQLCADAAAQERPTAPLQSAVVFVPAKQIDIDVHKAREAAPGVSFIDLIEYSSKGGASVIRRTSPARAEVHKRLTDMWYVIEGGGTLVTGGSLLEPTQTEADELRGRGITGGEERQIGKGDFVKIPSGVPHWVRKIDGKELVYLVVKVASPESPVAQPGGTDMSKSSLEQNNALVSQSTNSTPQASAISNPLSGGGKQLVGTWRLISRVVTLEDGTAVHDPGLGKTPTGYLIYDSSGHVAAQLMRLDRPTAIDCGTSDPAPSNNSQSVNAYDAYFGTYTIDETSHTVTHHLEGALAATDVGKNLTREFQVSGDKLTIIVRTNSPKEKQIRTLVWERVP